jgi:cysteinyl-tRNA synthetase
MVNQTKSLLRHRTDADRQLLSPEKAAKIDSYRINFDKYLENDLNIPGALGVTWEMIKSNVPAGDKYELLLEFDRVLGLRLSDIGLEDVPEASLPEGITMLIRKRDEFRMLKKFDQADSVRKEIETAGYLVSDSPSGTVVRKK